MWVNKLVLSLFPGIGLLDRAFEEAGFCVVRGPDILWGGDIRNFHPPENHFWGIIGGPPCQDFSSLRRALPTGYGLEMLGEFARCVTEANPEWSRIAPQTIIFGMRAKANWKRRKMIILCRWWKRPNNKINATAQAARYPQGRYPPTSRAARYFAGR